MQLMQLLILKLKVQLKSKINFRTYFPKEELKEFLANSKCFRYGTGNTKLILAKIKQKLSKSKRLTKSVSVLMRLYD